MPVYSVERVEVFAYFAYFDERSFSFIKFINEIDAYKFNSAFNSAFTKKM